MAINCVTYNCRGWNSGSVTISDFIGLFDICFIQEHWLLTDQLHILSSYHPEFAAVSVSGINDDELLSGRPYGGCAILYSYIRSSLSSSITPLHSISNGFCALKVKDQLGLSILLVCVYMPSSDIADYQGTLGALEGFIESYQCDINVILGDFNVDFSRQSAFTHHLSTLMTSFACDLHSNTITYT